MRRYVFTITGILVMLLLGASYLDISSTMKEAGESGGRTEALADINHSSWLSASAIIPGEPDAAVDEKAIDVPVIDGEQDAEFRLESVNGITLWDDKETVVSKLGSPLSVEQDEFFPELEVLHYEGMEVGVEGGLVRYAAVPGTAGSITIDDKVLEVSVQAFEQALGPPDFTAEDGLVYQREANALKLYLGQSGEIIVIRYFHTSST